MQQSYLIILKKVSEPDDLISDSTQNPSTEYLEDDSYLEHFDAISERSQAIDELVQSLSDLAEIFKELSSLVVHQGTILDRIDYNVEQTLENVVKGTEELEKADNYQRCSRATGCIMIMIVCIVVLSLALILKHF